MTSPEAPPAMMLVHELRRRPPLLRSWLWQPKHFSRRSGVTWSSYVVLGALSAPQAGAVDARITATVNMFFMAGCSFRNSVGWAESSRPTGTLLEREVLARVRWASKTRPTLRRYDARLKRLSQWLNRNSREF